MYNCQIRKYIVCGILVTFGLCGHVLGNDLTDGVYTEFKDAYDLGLADEYLNVPYSPKFSKDPFGEAMELYEGMSSQTKVAGVKYVENALELKGCGLNKEKQWAIAYYYLPEFRGEIARAMKMEMGDYASENYVFDEEIIMNYCTEFYNCITSKSGGDAFDENQKITSGTPEDVKTNCKEFFQTYYREGQAEEKRVQNLQIAWLGNDKYVNATTEESPYDVMTDLGVVGELSFLQAKRPITPIFFDLPVFEKSKNSLLNGQNGGGSDCVEETYGGVVSFEEGEVGGDSEVLNRFPGYERFLVGENMDNTEQAPSLNGYKTTGVASDSNANGPQISDGIVSPLSPGKLLTIDRLDALVDGLGAYRLNDDKSVYYGSLCEDGEIGVEAEPELEPIQEEQVVVTRNDFEGNKLDDSAKVEYEELMDYMLDAVTSYASLSEEKAKEIEKKAGDVGKYNGAVTAEQTEAVAKKILGCYKSCVGLDVDGQLACMLRCSCGEIKSPIFDPDVNPGMGPIFMIRYCAVPAVNPRYFYEGSSGTDPWSTTLIGGTSSSGRGSISRGGSSNGGGGSNGGGSNGGGSNGGGSNGGGSNGGGSNGGGSNGGGSNGGGSNGGGSNGGGSNGGGSNGGGTCAADGGNSKAREAIGSSFNVGGTKMVSMEKGINEILGVVEKLAREGRLGIWTQQYNFLDSTTKMMDVADTFSFTVAANKKKIGEKVGKPTDEYLKRTMNTKDNNWLVVNHVANPLDNPATRNRYLLVGYENEVVGDISASANANVSRQSQGYLNVAPGFIVDQSENSNAARYAKISELFGDWLDFEGDFWAEKVDYLKEMDSYAKSLYAKKG